MTRIFVNDNRISCNEILIYGSEVNYIKNVLRFSIGSNLIVCDGKENDYYTKIKKLGKDFVKLDIIDKKKNIAEPKTKIVLYQGIPKSDKMEYIIQKAVEIGVTGIVPVMMERTVVKINGNKDIEKKLSRWNKISMEAAKQSRRGIIPKIFDPIDFSCIHKDIGRYEKFIVPYEIEFDKKTKHVIDSNYKNIGCLIGPEGGISSKEINEILNKGGIPVSLGKRILKTDTAGLVILSIILHEMGDI